MKYYPVGGIEVVDRGWVRDYVTNVTTMTERAGGRYLARTSQVERLEGEWTPPQLLLIIEWPSKEAAETFYRSPEYLPYRQRRIEGGRNELLLVPGEDVAGVAHISD
ncbi:MAG TPA: DUF1330 domain-containing protein [Frankiaceae bacterium]|nr:DUF1330 domain-containing protein [Frankiaceae bacterium]